MNICTVRKKVLLKTSPVFWFLICFLSIPLNSHGETLFNQKQLTRETIKKEIFLLTQELEIQRKKALTDEMQTQVYMIDNWHQFAEGIRANEEHEKKILSIKKKIQELENLKETLPKESSSKSLSEH